MGVWDDKIALLICEIARSGVAKWYRGSLLRRRLQVQVLPPEHAISHLGEGCSWAEPRFDQGENESYLRSTSASSVL